jgi:predicted transposase YbfD/YdcC
VNAFAVHAQLTLGQGRADGKGGEVNAVLALLDLIDIEEAIVTMDAASTYRPIAQKVLNNGGDYILAVKGNQPKLNDELRHLKEELDRTLNDEERSKEGSIHNSTVKGHGRIETRTIFAMPAPDYLKQVNSWPEVATVVFAHRQRCVGQSSSLADFVYITSLPPDADLIAPAVQAHWGVESLHWHLDVTYREDQSRVVKNHGPENLSLLRKMAHNLLKTDTSTKHSVRGRQIKALSCWDFLLQVCRRLASFKI